MDDLISRKALLEAAEHNVEFQEGIVDVYILESILAGMPAVDAAPVVHGRWKWIFGKPYCECCAIEPYRASNNEMPNYCPNCGAKMDGGNDND